jgi:predicted kinase
LPGAGKTTRAKQIERETGAFRLTPDDWLMPTLAYVYSAVGVEPRLLRETHDEIHTTIETMLLRQALQMARIGGNVVVDFGLWARDERTALRCLFADQGALPVVEYVAVSPAEQRKRIQDRHNELDRLISADEIEAWRQSFQAPTTDELQGEPLDHPPAGAVSWSQWAHRHWPGLDPAHE